MFSVCKLRFAFLLAVPFLLQWQGVHHCSPDMETWRRVLLCYKGKTHSGIYYSCCSLTMLPFILRGWGWGLQENCAWSLAYDVAHRNCVKLQLHLCNVRLYFLNLCRRLCLALVIRRNYGKISKNNKLVFKTPAGRIYSLTLFYICANKLIMLTKGCFHTHHPTQLETGTARWIYWYCWLENVTFVHTW
jgi:hypothetical protein